MQVIDLDGLKITGNKFSMSLETRANTYHRNGLEITGGVASDLYDIELLIDNKPIQRWADGDAINRHQLHYGRISAVDDKHIKWFHERPELEPEFRYLTSIGTFDVGTMVIKGKIKDAVKDTIDIKPYAKVGEAQYLGTFTRIETNPYSTNKAGVLPIDDLPISGVIAALHIESKETTAVKNYDVIYNRQTEKEGSKTRFDSMNDDDGFEPIANTCSVSWMGDRNPASAYEVGPRRFVLELDFEDNADKAVDVIVETFSTFNG